MIEKVSVNSGMETEVKSEPRKRLLKSYVEGLLDSYSGETYPNLLRYFFPELITSVLLYALVPILEGRWIAGLKSTSLYATVGVTNTLIHFVIKAAEGFCVGTVVLAGQYNGLKDYKEVGKSAATAFWVTFFVGFSLSFALYSGAYWIYWLYDVPEKMIYLGIPYLRLKAVGIFFMFIFFAFIGFLRGIKKPRVPMQIFVAGSLVFLFLDYALINGSFGFPALGLQGSAIAFVSQYIFMFFVALAYIIFDEENRKYSIDLLACLTDWERMLDVFRLSWPVVLDKATFAAAYIWLGYLINPMGKYAIASYSAIKDLERLAIQPAAACAQVITYLVSNSYSIGDWKGIKTNIKKTIFLSSLFVFAILIVFSLWPHTFIGIFDPKNKFTDFAATVFPMISFLVFFDLLQLILSGALRGAANVKLVMMSRVIIFLVYFMPVSYMLAHLPLENQLTKFLLVYGSFYLGSGLMSLIYIYRFRGERWKTKSI